MKGDRGRELPPEGMICHRARWSPQTLNTDTVLLPAFTAKRTLPPSASTREPSEARGSAAEPAATPPFPPVS